MEIRRSTRADIPALTDIFCEARATIALLGIDQWQNGYPSCEVIENDIERAQSYSVLSDGEIVGTFALIFDGEPTYDRIFNGNWLRGYKKTEYLAIHRVAISVKCRGSGISTKILDFCAERARECGMASLRIDTHRGNIVMRKMLEKNGFVYCGNIFLSDGAERVAYEKLL